MLVIKLGKHLATQARVQALDDVSNISGVQLVQRFVGNGEFDVGEVALDQVHVAPRDDALLHGMTHGARNARDQVLQLGRKAAQQTACANLCAQKAKLR